MSETILLGQGDQIIEIPRKDWSKAYQQFQNKCRLDSVLCRQIIIAYVILL